LKQASSISASAGAILSSLATLACCLPLGFAAASVTASASAFLGRARPWLLGLSVALIGVGFWQQRLAKQCSVKGRAAGAILLWTAVFIVTVMILFPQQLAGFIADHVSWGGR